MCGVFALFGAQVSEEVARASFQKCQRRGPEYSSFQTPRYDVILGFHRLAINGLDAGSNQPLVRGDLVLICNGEIYNHKILYQEMGATPETHSDCEVILHMYERYGILQTLMYLDGVFAFVLWDKARNEVFAARDPFGVRPLYWAVTPHLVGFASEAKCLVDPFHISNDGTEPTIFGQFPPGRFVTLRNHHDTWNVSLNESFFCMAQTVSFMHNAPRDDYGCSIRNKVMEAVAKRCDNTERPVACLLSGGLDSSLVAALVARCVGKNKPIETFSIGLEGSEDLAFARKVAEHIGSKHHEVVVSEDDMFRAIPEVVDALETYDVTTVRASLGNYLLGKYIAGHSDAKVIFNGDGSDELFGGYLYMHKCPDSIEFDKETRRLLTNIHKFDVLRSDKSISSHGLEPRTPFLDKSLVCGVLSIPCQERNHTVLGLCEKVLLRNAFAEPLDGIPLLPDEVLMRKKEAFSDGVTHHKRSLFTILQEKIASLNRPGKEHLSGIDLERDYYKELFEAIFPNNVFPNTDIWMPKYVQASDPSARTLDIYKE